MACRALLLAFTLAAWPVSAQPFQGQIGTPDQALLGEDWYLLTPSEMPLIPLEGVTVSVLDCGETCPDPVTTDTSGWFTFPGLEEETARLRFDPPPCPDNDPECEPLEPREEEFMNDSRTVLGAKWPGGVEDTVLRYMPLIAGAIYIKWEGEFVGRVAGACATAGTWAIRINEQCRSQAFKEYESFVHEIAHLYERRLRLSCWRQHPNVDGWILREAWLRTYEADSTYREENDLTLRELDTKGLDDAWIARETLAMFAGEYFMPETLTLNHPFYGTHCDSSGCRPSRYGQIKTYRELETYAPNRYAYFEKLVFERYLDEKQWRRDHPDGQEWPGMCEAPPFESEPGQEPDKPPGVIWPFAAASKASRPGLSYYPVDPPPVSCSFSDLSQ